MINVSLGAADFAAYLSMRRDLRAAVHARE
jgi:hypothetical protein